ncbi:MAG: Na+/H+ antiporter subunit E [Chloroflexaceae bacterium]|nr:Na+/H+ antiporter subunit E [Chloroflexaceae bacterium]
MFFFMVNIFLALAWVGLTGQFTSVSFLAGMVLGYIMLWLVQSVTGSAKYVRKVPQVIGFVVFFLQEVLLANLRVASTVLFNQPKLQPGIIEIDLDIETDIQITLLANLITLTPGTLSMDVSNDKKRLFVHSMHLEDVQAAKKEIKEGFERRILEVFE